MDKQKILMQIDKASLKQGQRYVLDNEPWCEEKEIDSYASAEVLFKTDGPNWSQGFIIWFNGAIVHHSKTFSSLQKKLGDLIEKWHLTLREDETDNQEPYAN